MPDLPEILAQEGLTLESLFYQMLLGETQQMRSSGAERRRIANRHRDEQRER